MPLVHQASISQIRRYHAGHTQADLGGGGQFSHGPLLVRMQKQGARDALGAPAERRAQAALAGVRVRSPANIHEHAVCRQERVAGEVEAAHPCGAATCAGLIGQVRRYQHGQHRRAILGMLERGALLNPVEEALRLFRVPFRQRDAVQLDFCLADADSQHEMEGILGAGGEAPQAAEREPRVELGKVLQKAHLHFGLAHELPPPAAEPTGSAAQPAGDTPCR